jgi:PBP1b-binding outer membrane lipoprotein LpoB
MKIVLSILGLLGILFISGCVSPAPSPDPYQDIPWDIRPQAQTEVRW